MHFPAPFPFQEGLIKQGTPGSNCVVEAGVGEINVEAAKHNVSGIAGKARVSIWNNHLASEDTFLPPTKPVLHSFFWFCSQPPLALCSYATKIFFFWKYKTSWCLTAEDKRISKRESGKESDALLSFLFYKDEVPSAGADISSATG